MFSALFLSNCRVVNSHLQTSQVQPDPLMASHIHRVRRTDEDGSFVLINVISAFEGSSDLDIKILGTEGELAYVASGMYATSREHLLWPPLMPCLLAKKTQLSKFRAKKYDGSEDEWQTILSFCLLQKELNDNEAKAFEGLEIVASIADEEHLSLTLRRNHGGITVCFYYGKFLMNKTNGDESNIDH